MNKKLSGVVAVILCVSMLFAGCGKEENITVSTENDKNVTESGALPIVKEKITLEIGLKSNPKVEDFDTNAFTLFLEEKTGIDLEFFTFASTGANEKLNVMLGSNTELPEVLMGFSLKDSVFLDYADQGIFVPLNDYIEKYGYWTKKMFEASLTEDLERYMISADGNYYWMPSYTEQRGNEYGGKAWINKKWLDKLGLEVPKTTEDLREVLKAFKTKDPNGNGKADEIGFTGSKDGWNEAAWKFLTNSFVYHNYADMVTVDDNHKVSYTYVDPEFKEALKYLNSLVEEGLFDVQSFTQDKNIFRALAASEDVVLGVFATGSPDVMHSENMERLKEYVALPPLEGPKGVAYAYKNTSAPKCMGVITKYCENPLAAFRLMDFMLSEEATLFSRYGVKGTDWTEAKETDICLFGDIGVKPRINQILEYGAKQNSHWYQINPEFRSSPIAEGMTWDGDELNGEYYKANALKEYMGKEPKNIFVKALYTPEESEEYNELYNTIHNYATENVAMFVTGRRDVDKEWDTFQKELDNMGLERFIELTQSGYDRFRGAKE
ncbi:MAG: extracellular solute-binding protein [Ruminococcaceae bacterium]|nr:extracellular solute-binding protein [Oscillospiraceae bacterium]